MLVSLGRAPVDPVGADRGGARRRRERRCQVFRRVTLPLLMIVVAPLLIASFAFNFNNFNNIYLLTGGGPLRGRPVGRRRDRHPHLRTRTSSRSRRARARTTGSPRAVSIYVFLIWRPSRASRSGARRHWRACDEHAATTTVDFRTTLEAERLASPRRAAVEARRRGRRGRHLVAPRRRAPRGRRSRSSRPSTSSRPRSTPTRRSAAPRLIPRERHARQLPGALRTRRRTKSARRDVTPSWYVNSIFVATFTAFFTVMLGALAAYAFSRFRFQGRRMGLLFLLLIQMFPQLLMLVAIYLIVLRIGEVFPALGLNHAARARARLPRRRAGRERLADEGVLRLDPARAGRVGPRRRRDPRPDLLGRDPAARGPRARRRRAVRRSSATFNEFAIASRPPASERRSARCRSACRASSTDQYGQRWGPFAAGVCSRRSRPCSCSPTCSGSSSPASRRAPSRDEPPRPSPSRTTTARSCTSPSRRPSSATRSPCASACPAAPGSTRSRVRYMRDGEPRGAPAVVDEETDDRHLVARDASPVWNPVDPLPLARRAAASVGYALDHRRRARAASTSPTPTTSSLAVGAGGPDWHLESVVYEIFPDRFATQRASAVGEPPDWAVRRGWDESPAGCGPATRAPSGSAATCAGIEQRLDHVERARRERPLPHPDLPGRQHAPLRRRLLRPRRPAARRRRGARVAHARGARARHPRRSAT